MRHVFARCATGGRVSFKKSHLIAPSCANRRPPHGLTLLEVLVAIVVLVIAVCGLYMSYLNSLVLEDLTRQSTIASDFARQKLEQIQSSGDFSDIFESNLNATFDVPGLKRIDDTVPVGKVLFPVVGTALHEDTTDSDWNMPRDLNGDKKIDANDHTTDYMLLPINVRIDWQGPAGPVFVELKTLLARRK